MYVKGVWDDGCLKTYNVVLDKDVVQSGMRPTGLKTQRELIDLALCDPILHEGWKTILVFSFFGVSRSRPKSSHRDE